MKDGLEMNGNITSLTNHILNLDSKTLHRIGECARWHEANPPFNFTIFVSQVGEIVSNAPVLKDEPMSVAFLVAAKIIEELEQEPYEGEQKELHGSDDRRIVSHT